MLTETKTEQVNIDIWEGKDDATLISMIGACLNIEAQQKDVRLRLERELQHRMEAINAKEIPHPDYICTLETPSPGYDITKLRAGLGELVEPEILSEGFTDRHEETIWIEAKYDMRVIKVWTKYGDAVADIIQAAMLPKPARLKVDRRE